MRLLPILCLVAAPLAAQETATGQDAGSAKDPVVPAGDLATADLIEGTGDAEDAEAAPEEGDAEALAAMDAADIEAGAAHYKKNCRACHGPTGKGVSSYPKLAGSTVEHLTEMLMRYRAGEKVGPNTMLMAPRAKKLTDEDIANIVHWIASLE